MARNNKEVEDLAIEDAEIRFSNFSGRKGKFNNEGDRSFCVLLNPDAADDLLREGWNVKTLTPKDPEDEPVPYISVKVNYNSLRKPVVNLITEINGKPVKKNNLDEDTICILDYAEIDKIDMVIRPYHYDVNGRQGISAYLKSMYVTIKEDPFAAKYIDVPESAKGIVSGD